MCAAPRQQVFLNFSLGISGGKASSEGVWELDIRMEKEDESVVLLKAESSSFGVLLGLDSPIVFDGPTAPFRVRKLVLPG